MTLSTYPSAIPSFTFKRNLLDDVDANDINKIQQELTAVATTVGARPHVHTDVAIPQTVVPVVGNPGGDVVSTITYSSFRSYDAQSTDLDYGTVTERLRVLQRGGHKIAFKLRGAGINLTTTSTNSPKSVRFPAPVVGQDPGNMYTGASIAIRKSGFWVFSGSAAFTFLGASESDNQGVYQAAIDLNGAWLEGAHRQRVTVGIDAPVLNPLVMGYYSRGTTVTLKVSQSSPITQQIQIATLSGFLLRED